MTDGQKVTHLRTKIVYLLLGILGNYYGDNKENN